MSKRYSPFSPTSKRDISQHQGPGTPLKEVDRKFQLLLERIDNVRFMGLQPYSEDEDIEHQSLQHTLERYDERINSLEERTQKVLANHTMAVREKSEGFKVDLWEKTTDLIEQQSEWMLETLEQERNVQQSRVRELQDSYEVIQHTIDQRKQFAAQAIESAKGLFVFLNAQYKQEPGWQAVLPGFEMKLAQTECNLDMGFEEAALAGAQQLFQEMTGLRYQIEAFVLQRQNAIDSVQRLAERLNELISRSQRVQAIDLDGKPLHTHLDVDFWADGQLRPLHRQVNGILRQVNQPPAYLAMDEIDRLGRQLVSIREQVPAVIYEARLQAISSQMRVNIAECALAALRSQGYELIASGFTRSDMRQAYYLELANLAGSQVFVDVSPVNEKPLVQNLAFQTKEQEPLTDHEVLQRHNELKHALQWFGLDIGNITGPGTVIEYGPLQKLNISELRPVTLAVS